MVAAAGRQLPIQISATNETAAAAQATRADIRSVVQEVKAASATATSAGMGVKELIGNLKENFGRSSAFFQIAKIAGGGGAIVGIQYAISELVDVYHTVNDLMLTHVHHSDAAYESIKKEHEETLKLVDALKQAGEARESASRSATQSARLATEPQTGTSRSLLEAGLKEQNQLQDVGKKFDSRIDELTDKWHKAGSQVQRSLIEEEIEQQQKERKITTDAIVREWTVTVKKIGLDFIAKQSADRIKAEEETNGKLLDAQAKFNEAHFKNSDDSVKAEEAAAARERDKQQRDFVQTFLKRPIISPVNFGAVMSAAQAPQADYDQKIRDAKQKQSAEEDEHYQKHLADIEKDKSHGDQVERASHQSRMDMLRAQATSGKKLAEIEARRLEIVEQANERYRELQRIIDDVNTSEEDKKKLRDSQTRVRGAELIDLIGTTSRSGGRQFAAINETRGTTGATDILRNRTLEDPAAAAQQEIARKIQAVLDGNTKTNPGFFDNLWQSLKKNFPALNDTSANPIAWR